MALLPSVVAAFFSRIGLLPFISHPPHYTHLPAISPKSPPILQPSPRYRMKIAYRTYDRSAARLRVSSKPILSMRQVGTRVCLGLLILLAPCTPHPTIPAAQRSLPSWVLRATSLLSASSITVADAASLLDSISYLLGQNKGVDRFRTENFMPEIGRAHV